MEDCEVDQRMMSDDLLQRMKDRERMIEQELRNYSHWQAMRKAERTDLTPQPTLIVQVREWLRERLPSMTGPARVNVNLNIAIVYAGAEPTPAGELRYDGERVEWNQFIDAIKGAVQDKLVKAQGDGDQRVEVFVQRGLIERV